MGLTVGELRIRDVRLALGPELRTSSEIGVLVLGVEGEPPFVGPVALTTKRSGPSEHLALLCGACLQPRSILYARDGSLTCAVCSRKRTRRQSERTLATWSRGGREEDRLLRMVGKGRDPAVLHALLGEIIEGDHDRASVIEDDFHAAVLCIEARS